MVGRMPLAVIASHASTIQAKSISPEPMDVEKSLGMAQ